MFFSQLIMAVINRNKTKTFCIKSLELWFSLPLD